MKARSHTTIVTILGLALSVLLFLTLWGQETTHIAAEFAENAETSALAIESAARQYQHDVEVIHAFFVASSAGVTRAEFRSFVQLHMQSAFSSPGLQVLIWAPVVNNLRRESFIAELRQSGFPDFTISEYAPDGSLRPAADRAEYVVGTYNEPFELTRTGMGFDLLSEPIRRAALERARDSGQAAATAPIKLVVDSAPGFLIFQPLYTVDAPIDSVAARRGAIQSYVAGVFRSDELLRSALTGPDFAAIDFYFFDQGVAGDQPFYMRMAPSSLPSSNGAAPSRTQLLAGISYDTTLDVAGRSWRVIARPNPSYIAARRTWTPWVALIVGLAITAGIARAIAESHKATAKIRQLNSALEQRVAERTADLSQANARLQRALQTREEFLATMSHELRTPLSGILSFSELLLEQIQGPINERQVSAIQSIQASGRHLLTLINDILDLSKIEAGHMELHAATHLVADICEASLLFVSDAAARKGLEVGFTCSDTLAMIDVDAKRVKQMLVNLLGNAVKFTPPGGRVNLDVQIDAEHNLVSFRVSDSGIGIAAGDMSRLFQPFTQLDSGLNRRHEGTGLGLALVCRLADMLGGSVSVESDGPGEGSRFTLALPWRRHGPGQPAALSPAGQAQRAADARILLAEDNETMISALSGYLQGQGCRVALAHNGQEALTVAIEHRPDLVLMDIQMPVVDGLEAIRQLRAMPSFARTPIVALTALAVPGDRERCLAAGADAYLSKPVSPHTLAELIERLL